jgi:hypothetical protein
MSDAIKNVKMLSRDAVDAFYDLVVNAHQEGKTLWLVDRLNKAQVISPVEAAVFRHANDTVTEFRANLSEPEGLVYALFGYEAAMKYVFLSQFLRVINDGSLDWLEKRVSRSSFDGIPAEDVEMFLHHSDKND